jgi:cytochrome c biogenesis protein CcdA
VVFTLLLRASTALIDVPPIVWQWVSGAILIGLGAVSLFPQLWVTVAARFSLQSSSNKHLVAAHERGGTLGAIMTGSALGPVFSSCSPLYLYVIVTVLPASFADGMVLLLAYVIGLCGTLLAIALLGQKAVGKARWIANPDGSFTKVLGVVFILVGVAVILGLDRELQFWVIENSPIRPWELDQGFIPGR